MRPTAGQATVLEALQSRWQNLEAGASRLVAIHGPPGTGKTAAVHLFYRWLVAQGGGGRPSFWPPELRVEGAPREVWRKSVRPGAPADAYGALSFAWLGRSCRSDNDSHGAVADVEHLVSEQMAQVLYMDLNQADRDLGEGALTALLALLSAGAGALVFGPAGALAGAAVSWAMAGDQLRRFVRLAVSEEAQLRTAAERVGRLPWERMATRNQVTVARLERLAKLGLPSVLALDDAHHADQASVALCHAIVASPTARVLIVATADGASLLTQMEAAEGFGSILATDLGGHYRPTTLSLNQAHLAELTRIAGEVLPGTDRHLLDQVVRAGRTSIEATVAAAERAAAGLRVEILTPEQHLEQRWMELDADLRRYLSCMAALQGEVWYADQPLDRLDVLPRQVQEDCYRRALAEGLLLGVDQWRLAFTDPAWYRLARSTVSGVIPDDQLASARRDLFDSISADKSDEQFWTGLPLPVQASLLRTHCNLYPDPSAEELDEIGTELIDSLDRLGGVEASVDRILEATRTVSRAVDLLELARRRGGLAHAQQSLQVQARYAYLPVAGRELADVLDEARTFTEAMRDHYGEDSAEHLSARWNEAAMHAAVYDFATACRLSSEILETGNGVLSSPTLLGWRRDHASWTGDAGRPREAAGLLRALLPEVAADLGSSNPLVFAIRHDFAFWLSKSGHWEEAAREYEVLLVDMLRVLDPFNPNVVVVHHHHAACLMGANRIDEAVAHLKKLVPRALQSLGADSLSLLTIRHELAYGLGLQGHLNEAVADLTAVVSEMRRVIGVDSMHYFAARRDLVRFLSEMGRSDAIEQHEALLSDVVEVLGSDSPYALEIRHNLAACLDRLGNTRRACEEFEALLMDAQRALGKTHPQTLLIQRAWDLLCR